MGYWSDGMLEYWAGGMRSNFVWIALSGNKNPDMIRF
jgi:hypothetical protein